MSLTKAELEKIISQLQDIPPPSDEERILSQREVIQRIRPVIKKLRSKGYTPQQVQAILDSSGLEISKRQIELSTKRKRQSSGSSAGAVKGSPDGQRKTPSTSNENPAEDNSELQYTTQKKSKSRNELKDDQLTPRGSSHFTPDPDQEDI